MACSEIWVLFLWSPQLSSLPLCLSTLSSSTVKYRTLQFCEIRFIIPFPKEKERIHFIKQFSPFKRSSVTLLLGYVH